MVKMSDMIKYGCYWGQALTMLGMSEDLSLFISLFPVKVKQIMLIDDSDIDEQ